MSINPKWKWDKERFINDCMSMVINREELENGNISKDYFSTGDVEFVEKEYIEILNKVFDNFNLSEEFKNKILNGNGKDTTKLIFYTQYFAGCCSLEYARAMSYINLSTFVSAALNKDICSHKIGYGLMQRLQPFSFYVYEKPVYINCIAKIALLSLMDHYNDREDDKNSKYKNCNPFLTGEITEEMFIEFRDGLIDITKKGI